ncbi:unnamed protein product [Closterium sp. NIES-65]|nr:unnamed protein product [Closterium sp. NIES-65]
MAMAGLQHQGGSMSTSSSGSESKTMKERHASAALEELRAIVQACATMLNRKPSSLKRAFERRHPQLAGEADSALYATHLLLFALHRALRACTLRTALAASKVPFPPLCPLCAITVPLDQLLYRSITTFATLHRMHLEAQQQQQRARRQASSKGAGASRGAPPRPPSMGHEQQVQAVGREEERLEKERALQAEAMALGFTRVAPLLGELATPATAACLHHHLAFTRAANSPSAQPPPSGLSADRMHQFVAAVAHEQEAMGKRTGVIAAALGLQEREVVVAESDATLYIDAPGAPKTLVGHGRLYLTPLALYFQADATGFLRTVAGRVERFDLAAVGVEAAVAEVAPDALALNVFSMTRSLALSSRLCAPSPSPPPCAPCSLALSSRLSAPILPVALPLLPNAPCSSHGPPIPHAPHFSSSSPPCCSPCQGTSLPPAIRVHVVL